MYRRVARTGSHIITSSAATALLITFLFIFASCKNDHSSAKAEKQNILSKTFVSEIAVQSSGSSGSLSGDGGFSDSKTVTGDLTAGNGQGKTASVSSSKETLAAATKSQEPRTDNTAATSTVIGTSTKNTRINLEALAKQYSSTKGRVAMAVIINKLDNSTVIEDFAKKSARELFNTICEMAPQKSYTLEGLDELYCLQDILASEKLYVNLQSNNASPQATMLPETGWVQKFENAVNSDS